MIFTEEKSNFNFPHISVKTRLRDGQPCAYIATADEGYVLYDTMAENYEHNMDSEPVKVNHYYSKIICPLSYNFSSFSWEAVPMGTVSEDYIF